MEQCPVSYDAGFFIRKSLQFHKERTHVIKKDLHVVKIIVDVVNTRVKVNLDISMN